MYLGFSCMHLSNYINISTATKHTYVYNSINIIHSVHDIKMGTYALYAGFDATQRRSPNTSGR